MKKSQNYARPSATPARKARPTEEMAANWAICCIVDPLLDASKVKSGRVASANDQPFHIPLHFIEQQASRSGRAVNDLRASTEMDNYFWEEAKRLAWTLCRPNDPTPSSSIVWRDRDPPMKDEHNPYEEGKRAGLHPLLVLFGVILVMGWDQSAVPSGNKKTSLQARRFHRLLQRTRMTLRSCTRSTRPNGV